MLSAIPVSCEHYSTNRNKFNLTTNISLYRPSTMILIKLNMRGETRASHKIKASDKSERKHKQYPRNFQRKTNKANPYNTNIIICTTNI